MNHVDKGDRLRYRPLDHLDLGTLRLLPIDGRRTMGTYRRTTDL
jgi:hypothetical protein